MESTKIRRPHWAGFKAALPTLFTLLVFAAVPAVPRLRRFSYSLSYFFISLSCAAVFSYLRVTRPESMRKLDPKHPLLQRLRRRRRISGWTGAAGVVATVAALAFTDSSHVQLSWSSLLLYGSPLATMVGGGISFTVLGLYITERTENPLSPASKRWPGVPPNRSDFKPFHSEHWGNAGGGL